MNPRHSPGAPRLVLAAATMLGAGLVAVPTVAAASDAASIAPGTVAVVDGTLLIAGTNGPDSVQVGPDSATSLFVLINGGAAQHFDLAGFSSISVSLRGGDDQYTQLPGLGTVPASIQSGNGNDTIRAGEANDVIDTGAGNDLVDAGRGNDVVSLGAGDDTFQWDPGDGSDAVNGAAGADTMMFNGSNVAETMSLVPSGHHALFLRNVALVQMDMSNVERFDVTARGGADTLTIGDLKGTDVTDVGVDLSGTPGTDGTGDSAADQLTIEGTQKADAVQVVADGAGVDVLGLPAVTHITGHEPALDRLQVDTLGGNDSVVVDPMTLLTTLVDLGSGQR